MKNLTKFIFAAIIAVTAVTAHAQDLGEGIVINPYPASKYQTFLQTVTLMFETNEQITIADEDLMVLVNFGGEYYEVFAEVYYDPELALDLGQLFIDKNWGNELVIDFSDDAINAGHPLGAYTIDIPEGLVKNQKGETNADQTINFILVDTVDPVSVTPVDGEYPASVLKNIEISFDETINLNPERGLIEVREYNDWITRPYYIEEYEISEDGKSLSFDLSFLTRGIEYSVLVPEGFLIVGEDHINSNIWMKYMNWDGMEQATSISVPDLESTPKLNPFILTWDYQPITLSTKAPETEFICGFPDYGMQDGWRIWIPADYYKLIYVDKDNNINMAPGENEANAIYLDVTEFTEDFIGYQFEIKIPAGLVYNKDGLDNPPFDYIFTVRNLWIDPEVTAENGIINMIWPYAAWVQYNMSDEDPILKGNNGSEYILEFTFGGSLPGQVSLINDGDTHGIEINLSELQLANDTYTLFVPRGYVNLEDMNDSDNYVLNDSFEYKFNWVNGNFAGINSVIGTDIESLRIYDMQGRNLKGLELNDLKTGIYIINGKKIIIR